MSQVGENFKKISNSIYNLTQGDALNTPFYSKDGILESGVADEVLREHDLNEDLIPFTIHDHLIGCDTHQFSIFSLLTLIIDGYCHEMERGFIDELVKQNPDHPENVSDLLDAKLTKFLEGEELQGEELAAVTADLDKIRMTERFIVDRSNLYLRNELDAKVNAFTAGLSDEDYKIVRALAGRMVLGRISLAHKTGKLKMPDYAVIPQSKVLSVESEESENPGVLPGAKSYKFMHPRYLFEDRKVLTKAISELGFGKRGMELMETHEEALAGAIRDYMHDLYLFYRDYYHYKRTFNVLCGTVKIKPPEIWFVN